MVRSTENYETSPLLQTLKVSTPPHPSREGPPTPPPPQEQLSSLRDPLLTLALLLCLLSTLATAARRWSPSRAALAVLACCLGWHWLHMYRAAWAAKHSTLLQVTASTIPSLLIL